MGGVGTENTGEGEISTAQRCALTLLVPAYNEQRIVSNHLESIYEFIRKVSPEGTWEIIVIDDGSRDDTGSLAEAFAASHPHVRVHRHSENKGLGGALRTGFSLARGEVIIPLDIDLSYSVDDLARLIETYYRSGADIVLLSPYMPKGRVSSVPFSRRMLSQGANQFLSWCQGGRLHTSTGMVRAYKRAILEKLKLSSGGMEINLEILHQALLAGATVKEIPAHLDWHFRNNSGERVSRLKAAGVVRQMALVMHYAIRFLRARREVIKGVVR